MNKKIQKTLFSSDKSEWQTPKYLFDFFNNLYKPFDIDLAASDTNHLCHKYYTKEQDSLKQDWTQYNTCWLNPPYGRDIYKWIEKCVQTAKNSSTQILLLVPSRTDTKWFHNFIFNAYGYSTYTYFLKGRLKFLCGGRELLPAPFPSMLTWFFSCDDHNGVDFESFDIRALINKRNVE